MNVRFLILACLLGWNSASPLTHLEDAALERRGFGSSVKGDTWESEAGSIGSSSNSGTNLNARPETPSPVEIVNKLVEFLHTASDLVNNGGTENECNSLGSAAKQDCQECKDIVIKLNSCKGKAEENRKDCVCGTQGILRTDFSSEVETCRELIKAKNGAGNLVEACRAA